MGENSGQHGSPSRPSRELRIGQVLWQATDAGERVLRADWERWSESLASGGPAPIKTNPLRQIYRLAVVAAGDRPPLPSAPILGAGGEVGGPGGVRECFLKRYDESSLEGRVKRLLRGPAARMEWRHTRYAQAAGVAVPPPLAYGVGRRVSFLLTASCLPAENLDDYLAASGWDEMTGQVLARLLAAAHAGGVLHHDLHAGNVLCRPADSGGAEPKMWLLDLHKARIGRPVSPGEVIRNLASMVAGLRPWLPPDLLDVFLKDYLALIPPDGLSLSNPAGRARPPLPLAMAGVAAGGRPDEFLAAVGAQADRHAARLLRSRDRSILRPSRCFARIRGPGRWHGHAFLQRRRQRPGELDSQASRLTFSPADWAAALADPAAVIAPVAGPGEEIVKHSETGLVVRRVLKVGPHTLTVFVKHYPWRRRLAALADPFRRSRAVRAFKLGHQLLARNVPTALPLACLERRVGRWLVESILITEAVPRSVHLERFLVEQLPSFPPRTRALLRQRLASLLGQAISRMRCGGWVQRDMKAPNVLVECDDERQVRVAFVDLDGLHAGGRDELRPLVRLNDGLWSTPGVTLSDRMRVLRNYLGPDADCKRTWRAIQQATIARRRGRGL